MNGQKKGASLLDEASRRMCHENDVAPVFNFFIEGLQQLNESFPNYDWRKYKKICLQHDLAGFLHEDPFTQRAFKKPRGYAGDAIMLDYIYRDESIREEVSGLGDRAYQLFEITTMAPLSRAVKERCSMIAQKIDEYGEKINSLEILSVACGHMREVKISKCFKENKFKRCVGFDLDETSLQAVKEEYRDINIECIKGDILELAVGETDMGSFDLIYSAGLYDYLPQSFARRITEVLFGMLNPGGKLIIGNFIKNTMDIGFKIFTEIMMDWDLVYRTTEEMEDLAGKIKKNQIKDMNVFLEKNKHIAFLELVKRDSDN